MLKTIPTVEKPAEHYKISEGASIRYNLMNFQTSKAYGFLHF